MKTAYIFLWSSIITFCIDGMEEKSAAVSRIQPQSFEQSTLADLAHVCTLVQRYEQLIQTVFPHANRKINSKICPLCSRLDTISLQIIILEELAQPASKSLATPLFPLAPAKRPLALEICVLNPTSAS